MPELYNEGVASRECAVKNGTSGARQKDHDKADIGDEMLTRTSVNKMEN